MCRSEIEQEEGAWNMIIDTPKCIYYLLSITAKMPIIAVFAMICQQ
jgi:hypothetical protein